MGYIALYRSTTTLIVFRTRHVHAKKTSRIPQPHVGKEQRRKKPLVRNRLQCACVIDSYLVALRQLSKIPGFDPKIPKQKTGPQHGKNETGRFLNRSGIQQFFSQKSHTCCWQNQQEGYSKFG